MTISSNLKASKLFCAFKPFFMAFLYFLPFSAQSSPAEEPLTQSPRSFYLYFRKHIGNESLALKKVDSGTLVAQLDLTKQESSNLPQFQTSAALSRSIPENNRNLAVTTKMNYKIFDFGRSSAKEKALSKEITISSLEKEYLLEEAFWTLGEKTLKILNQHRLFELYHTIHKRSLAKRDLLITSVNRGLRPIYELKLADLEVQNHLVSYVRAEGELNSALKDFKIFLRQWVPSSFRSESDKIVDSLIESISKTHSVSQNTIDISWPRQRDPKSWLKRLHDIKKPIQHQIDFEAKIRDARKVSLDFETAYLRADHAPEVFLNLEASYGGSWEEQKPNYLGQLGIQWDIPWKGKYQAELATLATRQNILDLDYELTLEKRSSDFDALYEELTSLASTWEAQDALFKVRQNLLELTRERYQSGKSSAYELAQAELDISQTLIQKVQTLTRAEEIVIKIFRTTKMGRPEDILDQNWSLFK